MSNETKFEDKCYILSDLWMNYRVESEFSDFLKYNDLGLPLAYSIGEDIVKSTEVAENLIIETFDLLLAAVGVEDSGFDTLEDILILVEGNK